MNSKYNPSSDILWACWRSEMWSYLKFAVAIVTGCTVLLVALNWITLKLLDIVKKAILPGTDGENALIDVLMHVVPAVGVLVFFVIVSVVVTKIPLPRRRPEIEREEAMLVRIDRAMGFDDRQ